MTDRERFEEWVMRQNFWVSLIQDDDGYKSPCTRVAFLAWQASRKQALEQVMEKLVAEKQYGGGWIDDPDAVDDYRIGAEACANIVGDFLATPEGEQG